MTCSGCRFDPCICTYLAKLAEDGPLSDLRPAAVAAYGTPLPHLGTWDDDTNEWQRGPGSCPCPTCYAARLGSWTKETS